MKVLKFGGGVLTNKKNVFKLGEIIHKYNNENLIIVVSAFNKVTSKLEKILNEYFEKKNINYSKLYEIKEYHLNLAEEIFIENAFIKEKINEIFLKLENYFKSGLSGNYHYEYDRIVSHGELLSTLIITEFLKVNSFNSQFIDSRKLIITDDKYTEAKVDWEISEKKIKEECNFKETSIYITQGFVGASKNGDTTTLGREGSDFTASIFGYVLNAEEVVFWKEVDGIYNSDPSKSSDYELLPKLSYREALEQAYYGAKILHEKTIKPLQNKGIPIFVKSFYKDEEDGTGIINLSELSPDLYPKVPIFIVKENQILISVSTIDFSFISEHNLGEIFSLLSEYRIKVNLMQSSAINFSFCVTNNKYKIPKLIEDLKRNFSILYNDELELVTIRHYNDIAINKMIQGKKIYLEQKSRQTVRFVIK